MKKARLIWVLKGLLFCLSCTFAASGLAQISGNSRVPLVTIRATTPIASRAATNSALFTVYRAGNPTNDLNIYYRLSGTASNGVDYSQVGPFVFIPSGAYSSTITVTPINNGQTDSVQTVIAELTPSPLMTPVNYEIGSPSNAIVYIESSDTINLAPEVRLVNPANGAIFYTPVDITLVAYARDLDGSVSSVEFFDGDLSLGIVTNGVIIDPLPSGGPPPGTRAYLLSWTDVSAGGHVLTAKATDNQSSSTVSDPVKITVNPGPAPTNKPPIVRITSPPGGEVFRAPVSIPIFAYTFDFDGFVSSVQFFTNGNSLGFGRPLPELVYPGTGPVPITTSNRFVFIWTNAPLGTYELTALATDNDGASSDSEPVSISILPLPPPPTNRPPLVDIIATDPIAIEGTNCWRWRGFVDAAPTWSNWTAPSSVFRFFTNCGPQNALFTVRRFGMTNDDLTVTYAIGGTATNGVDYVALTGQVTIPAGQRAALIPIIPLDDGPPDINSTVVLKLLPSTNTPANYLVGFPSSAAALILDSHNPTPATGMLPDRCFHLNAPGPNGAWFHIDFTTDLIHWISLGTNQVVNGSIDFLDQDAENDTARFYRIMPEPGMPAF